MRSTIKQLLKTHAVKKSDVAFELSSGGVSNIYCNVKETILNKNAHKQLAQLLYKAVGEFNPVVAVAGVALGGCHLASIVGYLAGLDVLFVRRENKNHGLKALIEGPKQLSNSRIVLLEDVVTSGASSALAINTLSNAQFNVVGVVAVVNRSESKLTKINDVPYRFLFSLDELL